MHEAGEKVTHERRKKGSKYRESNGQEEGGTKRERVIGEREREKKREREMRMKETTIRPLMIVRHSSCSCSLCESYDFERITGILSVHTVRSKCIANRFFHFN
jgi:hypothetical protein